MIKFIELREGAKQPTRAHKTDSGIDFYTPYNVTVEPNEYTMVKLGVAVEGIMHSYDLQLVGKSGLAFKHGIAVLGGLIDNGYNGEICAIVYNCGKTPHTFNKGDKVCQGVIRPVIYPVLVTDNFGEDRESDGFGSTGK